MDARELLRVTARRYQFAKRLLAEEGLTEETPGYKERLVELIKQCQERDKL